MATASAATHSLIFQKVHVHKFLFADLDDSLFQSRDKCPAGAVLQPAAFVPTGAPIAFTTPRQRAFLGLMQESMTVIPATARNLHEFKLVDIAFSSYAILDYGGVILQPGGNPDPRWHDEMQAAMALARPGLREAVQIMDTYAADCGFAARAHLIEDFDTAFYIVMRDPDQRSARLAQIEREALLPWINGAGKDFWVHRNGNNLAVLPVALNKANAVRYLRERLQQEHGDILTFGLGDSSSDAAFMVDCDYAIIPTRSQLARLHLASP